MHRLVAALAAGLTSVAAAGCSSDESDPTTPTPVTTSVAAEPPGTAGATAGPSLPDVSLAEGVQESVSDALANMGLDQEQIDCLLEQAGDAGELQNMATITALLDECDIELSDITPGG